MIYPPSLLTRWSALVLKMDAWYGWQMAKCVASYSQRRVRYGCSSHFIYIAAKEVLPALHKPKHISFKSGCVVQVEKYLKGDWLIVLH